MQEVLRQARPAVVITLVMTVLVGLIYPLAMTGVGQLSFPFQANGSLLQRADGSVYGSALIGQEFTAPQYFHPRPSATLSTTVPPKPQPYNAANSGASNLGPTNRALLQAVARRAAAYRKENGLPPNAPVPVDAVTASGSGLDPDISLANALLQAPRVARARSLPLATVQALITRFTSRRLFGFIGEPRVNVLRLNRALDTLSKAHG
ncbi:MAG: K(+)-transporting ATPase subunit C [Chloroflexi bacterium]|nr:K(+)-transporting ATPase subunit C [Chloroflexota bacterium]